MTDLGQQLLIVVATLIVALGPSLVAIWFLLRRKRAARMARRSPLTADLLRPPGHALRERIGEARIDLGFDVPALMVASAFPLVYFYLYSRAFGHFPPTWVHVAAYVGVFVFVAYRIRLLLKQGTELDKLRLGLDAEMAVGQELNHLMRDGAVVFHDFPAENFNIDHVVIAPQGVFAVETKGYSKPNRNGGKADANVGFDGKILRFPDWSTSKPIEQAERQAQWLQRWLTSATGEAVQVTPVLALPGWFVDRKGRGDVLVFSGRELRKHLLSARRAQALGPEQMRRVEHQVEQRCGGVKASFRPDEEPVQ